MDFLAIPVELILDICGYLPFDDQSHLSICCRTLASLARDRSTLLGEIDALRKQHDGDYWTAMRQAVDSGSDAAVARIYNASPQPRVRWALRMIRRDRVALLLRLWPAFGGECGWCSREYARLRRELIMRGFYGKAYLLDVAEFEILLGGTTAHEILPMTAFVIARGYVEMSRKMFARKPHLIDHAIRARDLLETISSGGHFDGSAYGALQRQSMESREVLGHVFVHQALLYHRDEVVARVCEVEMQSEEVHFGVYRQYITRQLVKAGALDERDSYWDTLNHDLQPYRGWYKPQSAFALAEMPGKIESDAIVDTATAKSYFCDNPRHVIGTSASEMLLKQVDFNDRYLTQEAACAGRWDVVTALLKLEICSRQQILITVAHTGAIKASEFFARIYGRNYAAIAHAVHKTKACAEILW